MQAYVDKAAAARNRKALLENKTTTDRFYDEQSRILAQWTDREPPENLVLGELVCVSLKAIRFDNE